MTRRFVLSFLLILMATFVPAAVAEPIPVKIDLPSLLCIQTRTIGIGKADQVYLLVNGVAAGKEFTAQLPEAGKTLKSSPKTPPVTAKTAQALWNGKLDNGQAALVTVVLMQGDKQDAAKNKAFLEAKAAAEAKVKARAKATLTADDFKALHTETLKGHVELIKGVAKFYPQDFKADRFGGMFTLLVWNNNGTLVKRLDPVGLTAGEHFGLDVKLYSKIKFTRNNVLLQDEGGEWFENEMPPITKDQQTIRVKMLQTEEYTVPGTQDKEVTVVDYLADLQVLDMSKNGGKGEALKWKLMGHNEGPTVTHEYWHWAE